MALAAGLTSAGFAASRQKKANNEIKKESGIIERQYQDNKDIFNRQYNQDIINRTEISDLLRRNKETLDQDRVRSEALAETGGLTEEQRTAMAAARSKAHSDATAANAANASMLKDGYLNNWQNQQNNTFALRLGMQDKLAQLEANKSNQWATSSTNLFKTAGSVASAIA